MAAFAAFIFSMILVGSAAGQHCPYDGGNMVVVHLTDANGEPVIISPGDLKLEEIDNPEPDACLYKPGMILQEMLSPIDVFTARYHYSGTTFMKMCEGCSFLGGGFYSAILGQGEMTCITQRSEQKYDARPRNFKAVYSRHGVTAEAALKKENFFIMCTSAGKWSRFVPVELKISDIAAAPVRTD